VKVLAKKNIKIWQKNKNKMMKKIKQIFSIYFFKVLIKNTILIYYKKGYVHIARHNTAYQTLIFVITSLLLQSSIADSMETIPEVNVYNVPPIEVSPEYLAYHKANNADKFQMNARMILMEEAAISGKTTLIAKVIARANYEDLVYISQIIADMTNMLPQNDNININGPEEEVIPQSPTANFKEKLLLFIACSLTCIILYRYLPEIINFMSSAVDINYILKNQLTAKVFLIEDRNPLLIDSLLYKIVGSYLYKKYNMQELQRE
jgi:hypothetical protein